MIRWLIGNRWLLAAVAICIFVFVQSSSPSPSVSDNVFVDEALHALAHLLVFGALAFCLARHFRVTSGYGLALVVLATTLYGVTDEIHQSLVPSRTASLLDVVTDLVGAVLGVAIHVLCGVPGATSRGGDRQR